MSNGIFIVGTDTDVGKSFVSSGILYLLRKNNINASYFKAALSGAIRKGENLIPGDTDLACRVSGLKEDFSLLTPYIYETAVSPHLAAKFEHRPIDLKIVKEAYLKLIGKYDFIVAEGSGGIVCPIIDNDEKIVLLEDIIKLLGLETLLVARAEVGTINHTVLTVKYLESKGINLNGIIVNGYDKENLCHRDNVKMIERLTTKDIVALIPKVESENLEEGIKETFHEVVDYEKLAQVLAIT